ncbi:MAG: PD-(D/E)XK nuclease family protein [Erysipelotrichaceae bacterium]|nr:PD-(D/E)XK nuclease family protein [Erysipelotrichaceae bacterium]MDY5251289.1 PD-(D/E)XK nuclease family protein [Erysipelotrichaceae bacterium]
MKTIICPSYLKGYYLQHLLQDHDTIFDIKLLPFEAFAYRYEQQPQIKILLQARKQLEKLDLKIFAPMLYYPKFILEVVSFVQTLILYDQDIQLLPTNNPQECELKKILQAIYDLPHPQYQQKQVSLNTQDVEALDFFCSDLFTYKLKQQFLSTIPFSNITNPLRHGRYALNMRQEIESVAQDIVNKNSASATTIVLCDYANQLPLLKQIFQRYQIPFNVIKDPNKPEIIIKFTNLVNFMIDPSLDNLKECLFHHCFAQDIDPDLYSYFDTYITKLDDLWSIPNFEEITIINHNDLEQIKEKALRTQNYFLSIKDTIITCLNTPINEILKMAYEFVKDPKDITNSNKLAQLINDSYHDVQDKQDIALIMTMIDKITNDNANYQENSVMVSDLTHPVFANKYAYILGCTSKTFPNFQGFEGIFDEDYVSKLNILPLNQRFDLYMQQLNWIHNCATEIYYSYYTNDYANKVFELALEIEEKLSSKPTKWPLISNDHFQTSIQHLSDPTIFFDGKYLNGSVSSFERYFNCPYSYFLQYGLKLKESYSFQIEANTIGTIMHAIMEQMVKIYHKHYYEHQQDLFAIAAPYFQQLTILFPKQKAFIKAICQRLVTNLEVALNYLAKMEKDTSFEPYQTEYKFLQPYQDQPINIRGTIDRVDINHNYFRIIDYKSSAKKLQDKQIRSGLQLQLLTYMIMGEQICKLKPVGAYYYSLKNENLKVIAAKSSRNNITEMQEEDYQLAYEDNKKLEGLTIEDPLSCGLDHGNNIKSAKLDFNLAKDCLDQLYTYLYAQLSQGNIPIAPNKDGCLYCSFKNICLNKKQGEDKIIYEKSLKTSKGDSEDEV